ncbi:unnamed protein product [Phaedon cochleariae]|uniref:3-hydroxyisobutyryl-CoA hydrolase, mitochondrial n=1 Tax=Phaedon cochleariae TaxID=80249 RepID=A0A9P0DXN8_PHACE|nr:unnamed protein product [Phaedon cochleariae]
MLTNTSVLSVRQYFKTILVTSRKMSSQLNNVIDDVIIEDVGENGRIILNRPKALNALNLSMVKKIYPVLRDWETKKKIVLLKGTGEKSFCAGGDVRAVIEANLKGDKLGQEFFKTEYATNGLIGSYKIPYISLIDGIVMGGGVGLSLHGQYRIATERTVFAMPETQIGFFPDVGGSYFLPRLEGKLGWYLALTGHRLKGSDVLKAGIATHFCNSKDINELEESLMKCSSARDIEQALRCFEMKDVPEFSLKSVLPKIDDYFSAATIEEIIIKLEMDSSKWAEETIKLLNKMSPTSLKVTLKQLELGKTMNLKECLELEYAMSVNFLNHSDFSEGVRALLIDKDQQPKWKPPSLSEVSDEIVNSHFRIPNKGSVFNSKI